MKYSRRNYPDYGNKDLNRGKKAGEYIAKFYSRRRRALIRAIPVVPRIRIAVY